MRENRTHGLEGGGPALNRVSLPLSCSFTPTYPPLTNYQHTTRSVVPLSLSPATPSTPTEVDSNRLSYFYNGLDQNLVGVEQVQPIHDILA